VCFCISEYEKPAASQIETVSGVGNRGFTDGEGHEARFTLPFGIVGDREGGFVVFDTYNNAIRSIDSYGRVETISRIAEYVDSEGFLRGFYYDTIAREALLNRPSGGVFNADGHFFFSDSRNHVIRHIVDGRVYTFAGTVQGLRNGRRNNARFNTPMAIAVDDRGNIFVADTLNNSIRRISPQGSVSTIAGNARGMEGYRNGAASQALFRNPAGIAVSPNGRVIYVADTGNHVIRRIEAGQVTTVAGLSYYFDEDGYPLGGFRGGYANEAMFNLPRGIVLVGDALVVADSGNNMVRAIIGGEVITIAGNGDPGNDTGCALGAVLNGASGVYYRSGFIYIADTGNNKVKRVEFARGDDYDV
jgi:sugar lactone lactonase YvrE